MIPIPVTHLRQVCQATLRLLAVCVPLAAACMQPCEITSFSSVTTRFPSYWGLK